MNNQPLVSIGLSVYNAGEALRPALRSILNQTYSNWELLLIDDGSTDETSSVISAIKDPRIRYFSDGINKGLPARLNQAVNLAEGKYFARMDADDISYPERLARQVEFLEKNLDVDLVGTGMAVFRGKGELLGLRAAPKTHDEICARTDSGFCLFHPTWMGKREWFLSNSYAPQAVLCEDQDLLLRTHQTSQFANLPEPLLGYREERLSLSKLLRTRFYWAKRLFRFFTESCKQPIAGWIAVLKQGFKAAGDIFSVFTGLNYVLLRHRAAPAPKIIADDWLKMYAVVTHSKKKICFAATVPFTVRVFLANHLEALRDRYDITVVTNCFSETEGEFSMEGVRIVHFPFARKPDPVMDLICLMRLALFFRREGFDAVHAIMPKTGLLSMIAARWAGIPVRIHTFTGQVWAIKNGFPRWVLKVFDRILAGQATVLFADSLSQLRFLKNEGIIGEKDGFVLADGSICGVDTRRFSVNPMARERTRENFGYTKEEVVFLFLGRLNRDKGILLLAEAFAAISSHWKNARLLLVGPDEAGLEMQAEFQGLENVRFAGYTEIPEDFMNAADVFCLPSRREGFGSVIIEAACAGIPAVASRIYGITDAVVEGVTGLLHEPYSVDELAACMERFLADPVFRRKTGEAARDRAVLKFSKERVTEAMADFYRKVLN